MSDSANPSPLILADGTAWPEDAVEVGRIVDAWGVKGGIKVMPFSSDPQALFCTKKWFLRPADKAPGAVVRPSSPGKAAAKAAVTQAAAAAPLAAPKRLSAPRLLQVTQAREQGDVVVVTAEGLTDRNDADALRGARVFVSRSAFPTPSTGEYYWIDLIGLDVVNREGQALGKVIDLLDTGPHSVLRLSVPAAPVGETPGGVANDDAAEPASAEPSERLIPFVDAYIDSVSLSDKRIVADWGLDY